MQAPLFLILKRLTFTVLVLVGLANSIASSHADEITTLINGAAYSCSLIEVGQPNPPAQPVGPGVPGIPDSGHGPVIPLPGPGPFPGHAQTPVTCIQSCVQRAGIQEFNYSTGTCLSYGTDYCGRNPACITSCTRRAGRNDFNYPLGSCLEYGPDICTSQN